MENVNHLNVLLDLQWIRLILLLSHWQPALLLDNGGHRQSEERQMSAGGQSFWLKGGKYVSLDAEK